MSQKIKHYNVKWFTGLLLIVLLAFAASGCSTDAASTSDPQISTTSTVATTTIPATTTTTTTQPSIKEVSFCQISKTVNLPFLYEPDSFAHKSFVSHTETGNIWAEGRGNNGGGVVAVYSKDLDLINTVDITPAGNFVAVGPNVAYVGTSMGELTKINADGSSEQIWAPHGERVEGFGRVSFSTNKDGLVELEDYSDPSYVYVITDPEVEEPMYIIDGGLGGLPYTLETAEENDDGTKDVRMLNNDGSVHAEKTLDFSEKGGWMKLPGIYPVLQDSTDVNAYNSELEHLFEVTGEELWSFGEVPNEPSDYFELDTLYTNENLLWITHQMIGQEKNGIESVMLILDMRTGEPVSAVNLPIGRLTAVLGEPYRFTVASYNFEPVLLQVTCE